MAFVDEVTLYAESGKGGGGVVRWLRTKETARGGPAGGDGGNGGDVILVGVRDLAALSAYRHTKKFRACNGENGKNERKRGADGDPMLLFVPVGTLVRVIETGDEYDITKENERFTLFRGGRGGLGNTRFKSSTHQNPFEWTPGKKGSGGHITLTLKLIADAGLVGLPNAGKSSLLNALTRAKSKVGSYPFTTLEAHLGEFNGHILADIPGLIVGASHGRGLGIKFLKHIERTRIILHLVSAEQDGPLVSYREVRAELKSFGHGLADKPEIIVLSKSDLVLPTELDEKVSFLSRATGREIFTVSVRDSLVLERFSKQLSNLFQAE